MLKPNKESNAVCVAKDEHLQLKQDVDSLEKEARNNNIRIMVLQETDNEQVYLRLKYFWRNSFGDGDLVTAYRADQTNSKHPKPIPITLIDNQVKVKSINWRCSKVQKCP